MENNFSEIFDISYGDHERHKLDIFMPGNVKSDSGVILYLHGGGWHSGNKSAHYDDTRHFSSLGYICATMNYRYVSENLSVSDELDDITAALKTIKKECEKRGYNADKLILSGGSAGSHLALLYAYTRKDISPVKPVAVCVYCPPVDCAKADFLLGISGEFEDWKYDIMSKCCGVKITKEDFLNEPQQNALKKISPAEYVSENCVPTAIFHGKKDELIPLEHIYDFLGKLHNAGVKNDLLIFEHCGHSLDYDLETLFQSRDIIEDYAEKYF